MSAAPCFVCELCFVLAVFLILPSHQCLVYAEKRPLILVPGDGGSQGYCKPKGKSDYFLLWVNLRYFLTPWSLFEYFGLRFDPASGEISDSDACDVVFPGWGDTWSIENLDTSKHAGTTYFGYLISYLRRDPYFVSNRTIRGTPFDFRKAPNQNPTFVQQLKSLIEETYFSTGNRRVVVLAHSLGCLYALSFLDKMSDTWKKTFIGAVLFISGPYGGSVKAMKIEASGDNFGIYIRSALSFRPVQRSLPSTAFLLPDPRLFPATEPLVITPHVNYSAHDYEPFFKDINYTLGYDMMRRTKPSVDSFVGPTGIDELFCIHGSGVPTTYHMVYSEPTFYRSGFPDQYPTLIPGDGDGTVHMRSLELCQNWPRAKHVVFEGAEHLQIVADPRLIDLVVKVIGADLDKLEL